MWDAIKADFGDFVTTLQKDADELATAVIGEDVSKLSPC
jgi:hypothetical protein